MKTQTAIAAATLLATTTLAQAQQFPTKPIRFIVGFPDGELSGPGHIMSVMNTAGFEIRHEENLREHYALTLKQWCQNLEDHWDEAVVEAGLGTARVWRLYMAASRLGFELNTIQLHQTLGVKLGAGGVSGMPLRPNF